MNRPRPLSTFAITSAFALLISACSPAASPSTAASDEVPSEAATEEMVHLRSFAFSPAELTVAVGTEVVFVNDDAVGHTVTEGTDGEAVEDPIVDQAITGNGGEVRVIFDEAGTFEITCEVHPAMQMTVVVEG